MPGPQNTLSHLFTFCVFNVLHLNFTKILNPQDKIIIGFCSQYSLIFTYIPSFHYLLFLHFCFSLDYSFTSYLKNLLMMTSLHFCFKCPLPPSCLKDIITGYRSISCQLLLELVGFYCLMISIFYLEKSPAIFMAALLKVMSFFSGWF